MPGGEANDDANGGMVNEDAGRESSEGGRTLGATALGAMFDAVVPTGWDSFTLGSTEMTMRTERPSMFESIEVIVSETCSSIQVFTNSDPTAIMKISSTQAKGWAMRTKAAWESESEPSARSNSVAAFHASLAGLPSLIGTPWTCETPTPIASCVGPDQFEHRLGDNATSLSTGLSTTVEITSMLFTGRFARFDAEHSKIGLYPHVWTQM